jgi:hypothetical protein
MEVNEHVIENQVSDYRLLGASSIVDATANTNT